MWHLLRYFVVICKYSLYLCHQGSMDLLERSKQLMLAVIICVPLSGFGRVYL